MGRGIRFTKGELHAIIPFAIVSYIHEVAIGLRL